MRRQRRGMTLQLLMLLALLGWTTGLLSAQVRVVTYNIRFLSTDVVNQDDRLTKLCEVIALLDAHVIGLQEIADPAALELLFPPTAWQLVIDDCSPDLQDLAVAVRGEEAKPRDVTTCLECGTPDHHGSKPSPASDRRGKKTRYGLALL